MFFVINKEKIFSFVIAVGMVGVLLGMTNVDFKQENTVEASSSAVRNELVSNDNEMVNNEIGNIVNQLNI